MCRGGCCSCRPWLSVSIHIYVVPCSRYVQYVFCSLSTEAERPQDTNTVHLTHTSILLVHPSTHIYQLHAYIPPLHSSLLRPLLPSFLNSSPTLPSNLTSTVPCTPSFTSPLTFLLYPYFTSSHTSSTTQDCVSSQIPLFHLLHPTLTSGPPYQHPFLKHTLSLLESAPRKEFFFVTQEVQI